MVKAQETGTLADTEEKYLTRDEEFEAERKRRKLIVVLCVYCCFYFRSRIAG